jgi:hypothetical protein
MFLRETPTPPTFSQRRYALFFMPIPSILFRLLGGMVLRITSIIDSSYNLSDFLPFLSVVIAWATPKNGPLPPRSFLTDRCNNGCDGGD